MEQKQNTATAIFSVILLIVGMAVAGLLFTFTLVLGGETFEIVEDDIDEINSYSEANHTFVADNATWTLINASLRSGTLELYNTTGWTDNTSDFSVNYTTGRVLLVSDNESLNGTSMRAVYEFDDGLIRNAIRSGILSNFEAQQQIGDYMPIVVLAIIITLVIGLIISGIATRILGGSKQQLGKFDNIL